MKRCVLPNMFSILLAATLAALLAAMLAALLMASALAPADRVSAKGPGSERAWKGEQKALSSGSTLYVKPVASGSGNCDSWANACELQTALGSAASSDEIWAAEGVYYPGPSGALTATFQLKSGVGLYGGFAATETLRTQRDWVANPTILSGDIDQNDVTAGGVVTDVMQIHGSNAYHVVTGSGTDGTAILDGFTNTAGDANGASSPHYYGGGMYNANGSPTLTNVSFSGNGAPWGGGMYNTSGSPTLTVVSFSGNFAGSSGGGMYNEFSSPTLTDASFSGNSAYAGGGMYNGYSNPTLTNVTFSANSAEKGGGMYNGYSSPTLTNVTFSANSAGWAGGGMFNTSYSSPMLTNVTFYNNGAGNGGGIYNELSSPALTDVSFSGNSAPGGGGMFNTGFSSPTLMDVTFSGNSAEWGGGICNNSSSGPTLTNITFSGNSASAGGGMHNGYSSSPTLTNVILWGNTPDQIAGNPATVTYSDIQGGYAGEGNIDDDPALGPLADNGGATLTHALGPGSQAIDAGSPTTCPPSDQRGFPRPVDGDADGEARCDMGAYEYMPLFVYLPLVVK